VLPVTAEPIPCLVVADCTENHLRDSGDFRSTSAVLRDAREEIARLRAFVELIAGLDRGEDLLAANVVNGHDLAAAARKVLG
jgi:hypothetical protein